jgi:hypothetical protein
LGKAAHKWNACSVQSAGGTNLRFVSRTRPITDLWKFDLHDSAALALATATVFAPFFSVYGTVYPPFSIRFSRFFTVFTVF